MASDEELTQIRVLKRLLGAGLSDSRWYSPNGEEVEWQRRLLHITSTIYEALRHPVPLASSDVPRAHLWLIPSYRRYGIQFSAKPPASVLETLKNCGYAWSGKSKLWEKQALMESFSEEDAEEALSWAEPKRHHDVTNFFYKLCKMVENPCLAALKSDDDDGEGFGYGIE